MQRGFGGAATPSKKMSWSQDIIISVLFPYLVPSFPICKNECWPKEDTRIIFEELLMFYCCIPVKKTPKLLETFISRLLSISSGCNRNLDEDLYFIADIEKRSSSNFFSKCESDVYCLYVCNFLIEHGVDIHEDDDCALRFASRNGYKNTVVLLLEYNADVHAYDDCSIRSASYYGHTDIVALLLEHKADVHACSDESLLSASFNNHKDTVALLLEHKADIHADDDAIVRWATDKRHKIIVCTGPLNMFEFQK
jgi:hypothetical protein